MDRILGGKNPPGPFAAKIPKYGCFIVKSNFLMLSENFQKWVCISRKINKIGYLFLPKWPLKVGKCFEAWVAHPYPNQMWVPPIGTHISLGLERWENTWQFRKRILIMTHDFSLIFCNIHSAYFYWRWIIAFIWVKCENDRKHTQ